MECVSCSGHYLLDEHEPRNLRCGHVCCRRCIHKFVNSGEVIVCPKCQCKQAVDSLDNLPVSKGLMEALDMLRRLEIEKAQAEEERKSSGIIRASSIISLQSQELGSQSLPHISDGLCEDHGFYRVFYCQTCQCWICRDCTITEHKNCETKSARHGLESMKTNARANMRKGLSAVHERVKALEQITEVLNTKNQIFRHALDKIAQTMEKKKMDLSTCTQACVHYEENLRQLDEAKDVQEVKELLTSLQEPLAEDDGDAVFVPEVGASNGSDETVEEATEEEPMMEACKSCVDAADALNELAQQLKDFKFN